MGAAGGPRVQSPGHARHAMTRGSCANKCKELAAFTEPLINKTPTKLDMESVFKKITDLVDMQKDNEKSLIDHDRSRFQDSTLSSSYDAASNSLNMTTEEYGTTEILKQNALASQLAALNKQLAQKE